MASIAEFERIVRTQVPAAEPWTPVTDYSFETRAVIEGKHPDLIIDAFEPKYVADVGCGPGHLTRLLRERGVKCIGYDKSVRYDADHFLYLDIAQRRLEPLARFDLVMCREVLEHLTVKQIRYAVENLCWLSTKYVYVTTRFSSESDVLRVETADDLDPTHISLCAKDFVRMLFVLEGFRQRPDLERRLDWQQKSRCLVYERA